MRTEVLLGLALLLPRAGRQAGREARVLALGAKLLGQHAAACARAGWQRRARAVWREILRDYDPNDEAAHVGLGHVLRGTRWIAAGLAPPRDTIGEARRRFLTKAFAKIARRLHDAHVKAARQLARAGHAERARFHYLKALRFQPGDREAARFAGMQAFEGFFGSAAECAVLRGSRRIRTWISELRGMDFPVRALPPAARQPALAAALAAGPPEIRGVASEHFRVFGDFDLERLQEIARWAERALVFARSLFAGRRGFRVERSHPRDFAFLTDETAFERVVKRCIRDRSRREFTLRYHIEPTIRFGGRTLDLQHAVANDRQLDYDAVVRIVVKEAAALTSPALEIGVGHAAVGFFFGKTRRFTLDRPKRRGTRAAGGAPAPVLLPDFERWADLVEAAAFEGRDPPAAKLPLVGWDEMDDAVRVKAWSFVAYLLRREPALLRALDGGRGRRRGRARDPQEVAARFGQAAGGLALGRVEEDWRAFLAKRSGVLARWLEADWNPDARRPARLLAIARRWNERRALAGRPLLSFDDRVPEVWRRFLASPKAAAYARTARATEAAPPPAGGLVLELGGDPERPLELPGFRALLADPRGFSVGLYEHGRLGVLVPEARRRGHARILAPQDGLRPATGAPAALAALRARVFAELVRLGRPHPKKPAGLRRIGPLLSLHFPDGLPAEAVDFACRVTAGGRALPGLLLSPGWHRDPRLAPPKTFVFALLEPVPAGTALEILWSWRPFPGAEPFELRRKLAF